MLIHNGCSPLLMLVLLLLSGPMVSQPHLEQWSHMVSDLEHRPWVSDLESLETGCVLRPTQPVLRTSEWPAFSAWADALVVELESLPLAEHHANRALQKLLADDMLRFRLVETAADRFRPELEHALSAAGFPPEWAVLPMVITGWDHAYYGPGRRAGAWAMDMPTALRLGLEIRRGYDERHIPEAMGPAVLQRIQEVSDAFPESPMRQVLALVRGSAAGERFDPDSVDADLLGWLHLLRVMLQVDRNFQRDSTTALWLLRDRQWTAWSCDAAALYFSHHDSTPWSTRALRDENPWFTTDSIGLTPLRPAVLVPKSPVTSTGGPTHPTASWCGWTPLPEAERPVWTYRVRPGDVLGRIARKAGVRIADIQRWNDMEHDRIQAGQTLRMQAGMPPEEAAPPHRTGSSTANESWTWHTVQEGESYWSIASQYPGLSLADLMGANDIAPESLRPGMALRIPKP